jgi:hypothetical protein
MPQKSAKKAAALQREAHKRNETIAVTPRADPSLATDPNYAPPETPEVPVNIFASLNSSLI